MKRYRVIVAENVRRYTTFSVELTPEQAESLGALEQTEVDDDHSTMELLDSIAERATRWEDEFEVCDEAETVIIGIDEED